MLSSLGFCCTHLGPFMCMLRNWYLFQLADALFNTADRGHGPQRVRVQSTEAVLSADLQKGHHSSLLWTTQTDRFNTCFQISINNLMRKNNLQQHLNAGCIEYLVNIVVNISQYNYINVFTIFLCCVNMWIGTSCKSCVCVCQGQGQGFFICHMINYTGYNQKWNVGQIRSAQWTVQRIKKNIKNKK